MKMSQLDNFENNRNSTDSAIEVVDNECSIIEIIDNGNSRDSIIEISDGEDDSDGCIDLSNLIEEATDEDINDIRIIMKSENEDDAEEEDTVESERNCRSISANFILSPSALARGRALKRKHANNINGSQNQNEFRKRLNTAGSSRSVLTNAEEQSSEILNETQPPNEEIVPNCNEDGMEESIEAANSLKSVIKQEQNEEVGELHDRALSMSCSSIKSEEESLLNHESLEPELQSSQHETRADDISKIKWMRPLNNLASPPHLQIVVIDRSDPHWRISRDKWLMIEKRLLEELHDEMLRRNDASIGSFDGAKWSKGIKVIGCHNQKSLTFIKNFILNLNRLWIGAKLDVLPITQISRHIVRGYVPPPAMKNETILSLIKLQNPTVYSEDWTIIRERENANAGGGRYIWISISTESFHILRESRGEIKYGINRIFLNPSK